MITELELDLLQCADMYAFYEFVLDTHINGHAILTKYFISQMSAEQREEAHTHFDSLLWYDACDNADNYGMDDYNNFLALFKPVVRKVTVIFGDIEFIEDTARIVKEHYRFEADINSAEASASAATIDNGLDYLIPELYEGTILHN